MTLNNVTFVPIRSASVQLNAPTQPIGPQER